MSDRPEKACVNCHFFVQMTGAGNVRGVVESEEREASRNKDFDWLKKGSYLSCHQGVWSERPQEETAVVKSEGLPEDSQSRYRRIVETDREDYCFYRKYESGMRLEAAEKLQEREQDRIRFQERNLWVMVAAVAAAVSVVIDLLFRVGFFKWVVKLLGGG